MKLEFLKNKIYLGFVEDNVDKDRKGKVKIRVQGVFDKIDIEHIPWSVPFNDLGGRMFSVPGIGKIVNVIFPDGNLYTPEYIYSENYNINLQNKLNNLDDDEYKNFVALLFDHKTQIFSDDKSLTLDYFFNQIKITEKGIDFDLKNDNQEITLGTPSANQQAVLGSNFFEWFDGFMETLLNPITLIGNFGSPILRPELDAKITEYQALRDSFISNNVYINDNNTIEEKLDREIGTQSMVNDKTKINGEDIHDALEVRQSPEIEKEKEDSKNVGEKAEEENKKEIMKTRANTGEGVKEEDISDDYQEIKRMKNNG